jgi:protein phosphatase-4 regulatory subunit 3
MYAFFRIPRAYLILLNPDDPDFPSHKANYRDFLKQATQFHQPIPIQDITIQRKIHHTYRLQFLKDVVLARALDDSTFNVLNSCIIFNQIDIISHIQQDQLFLKEIVRLFVDEEVLTGGAQRYQLQLQMMQQQQQIQQMQQRLQGPVVISLPPADQEEANGAGAGSGTGTVNGEGTNVKKEDDSMDVDCIPKRSPTPPPPSTTPPPPPTITSITPLPANSPRLPMNGALIVNGRGTPNTMTLTARSGAYSFAPPDNLSEAEVNHRREVVLLIQQLCIMGKNVQLPARMALFRILVDRGILFAVQWAMNLPETHEANKQMISTGGEVLSALLDHDLNGVRGHVLKQIMAIEKERAAGKKGADKAETLLEMVCRIMSRSRDLAVQSLVGDALKVWMDTPMGDMPGGIAEASHVSVRF